MSRRIRRRVNYEYQESSASSSDSSSSSDSMDTSSRSSLSDDSDIEVYRAPEPKKRKSNSILKNLKETELNCDLIIKTNYRWTIQGFFKLCSASKTKEKIESPNFTTMSNDEMTWRLQLYPYGTNEQNKNNIVLKLALISSKEKVTAKCKCSFINHKNHRLHDMESQETFHEGQSLEFKQVIKTNALLNMIKIESDILLVECEIIINQDMKPSNQTKVVKDLGILLDSGNYSDVTLEVEDKTFNVHKSILAARTPVFDAMFKHDMKEKSENIVKISDISYPVMKEILRFAYTGKVENLDSVAKDLLAAADKYAFEDLKVMCENALFKKMNVLNVVDMLTFAELHSVEKLKEKALHFFVTKVKDVVNTPAFKAMAETQPLLAQVIRTMAQRQKS